MLTPADLKALPRAKATLTAHGKSITYEGPVLNAALKQAGVVSGDRLMGRYLNQVVIAKGSRTASPPPTRWARPTRSIAPIR